MATVTAIKPIKSHEHVGNAIDYAKSPTDVNENEKAFKVTCLNCTNDDSLSKQFYQTRAAYNLDSGILVHHYVQSFAPDEEITPQLAHLIGVELARKCMPGYQVLISTHIDKDHIHNHFLINAVNRDTGYKWHGNKDTLRDLRTESDKLCRKHNLSVLQNSTGATKKSVDSTTYRMAMQGKSWKVQLTDDLDKAALECKSKDEFIFYMTDKGYEVNYQNKNITIQPQDEKKKIRVDTLARQFGDKYKKSELEKRMGYYKQVKTEKTENSSNITLPLKKKSAHKTEYQRYEEWFFSKIDLKKLVIAAEQIKNAAAIKIKLFIAKSNSRIKQKIEDSRTLKLNLPRATSAVRSIVQPIMYAGNIRYRNLTELAGENITVNVPIDSLLNLVGAPMFYSCRISSKSNTATVTFKECNIETAAKLLGQSSEQIKRQSDTIYNNKVYRSIKTEAVRRGEKLNYRTVGSELLETLKQSNIKFACFEKNGNYNISFLPEYAAAVDDIIRSTRVETDFERNRRINRELKADSAKSGAEIRYRIISAKQLEKLKQSDIKFACFEKNGRFNISFLSTSEADINRLIYGAGLNK